MGPARLSTQASRRLFLGAQGLLEEPERRATKPALLRLIQGLGFVQMDTINVVGRAHDLTLFSRLSGYRPSQLQALLETDRSLFEGWTHDASAIPASWYAHWKRRFAQDHARIQRHAWWQNLLGPETERVCDHVLARISAEGPLGSADFDHPEKRGPWWGWKPQKAALDYLWRTGVLAIAKRVNFHKRYDLAERVLPEAHALPEPDPEANLEWACATAMERLGVFSAKELADFWGAIEVAEAKRWCQGALKDGRIVSVQVEAADGSEPQAAFAVADWRQHVEHLPEAPEGIRLLCPFDPVLRDRGRALRRFGFDYRFEAFTPESRRIYGYYVMPILEGDRLIGRLDPKLHRDRGVLEVRGLWWEPGVKPTKTRQRRLQDALERMAAFLGAGAVSGP